MYHGPGLCEGNYHNAGRLLWKAPPQRTEMILIAVVRAENWLPWQLLQQSPFLFSLEVGILCSKYFISARTTYPSLGKKRTFLLPYTWRKQRYKSSISFGQDGTDSVRARN